MTTLREPPDLSQRNWGGTKATGTMVAAVAVGLAAWFLIALVASGIPTPSDVASAWTNAVTDPQMYRQMLVTGRRVIIGWTVSLAVGSLVAYAMVRSRVISGILFPWYAVAFALPGEIVVLFAVLIVGVLEASTLLALIIATTPFVINVMRGGISSADQNLLEMGRVFRFGRLTRVREILIPHLAPHLLSASRVSFALAWKGVLSIEVFSRPDGVGKELQLFFRLLRADRVIAWTLTFMVLMVLIDWVIHVRPAGRAFAWRAT